MPNVKISGLPAATSVTAGTDVAPMVSGGITTKATPQQIVNAGLLAPGAIGSGTASTGAFTTLSASSTVSGTGFSTYLASPPAIGGTTPSTGKFTTIESTIATGTAPFTVASTTNVANLNASSLSGATFASPGAIGSGTASTGAFTTLSASSTVSGTGFSNYLLAPPAIGTTTPAASKFTTIEYTSTLTGGIGVINIGSGQFYKDASGNISLGSASTGYKFQVYNATPDIVSFSNGANGTRFGITCDNSGAYLSQLYSNSAVPWIFNVGAIGSAATEKARITATGDITIAGATATKASGTTWTNPSDTRIKDNQQIYNKGLAELLQIVVKTWEFNGKGGSLKGAKGVGVIADEIQNVLPESVDTYKTKLNENDETETDIKRFDASEIIWLLVNSIQEISYELNELKTKVQNV